MSFEKLEREERREKRRAKFNKANFIRDYIDEVTDALQKQEGYSEKNAHFYAFTLLSSEYDNAIERYAKIKQSGALVGVFTATAAAVCGGLVTPASGGVMTSLTAGLATFWVGMKLFMGYSEKLEEGAKQAKREYGRVAGTWLAYSRARRRVRKQLKPKAPKARKVKPLNIGSPKMNGPR